MLDARCLYDAGYYRRRMESAPGSDLSRIARKAQLEALVQTFGLLDEELGKAPLVAERIVIDAGRSYLVEEGFESLLGAAVPDYESIDSIGFTCAYSDDDSDTRLWIDGSLGQGKGAFYGRARQLTKAGLEYLSFHALMQETVDDIGFVLMHKEGLSEGFPEERARICSTDLEYPGNLDRMIKEYLDGDDKETWER